MHAMVDYLDGEVGSVIQLLKDTKQWNNTLVVFHSVTPLTHFAAPCYPARAVGCYLSVNAIYLYSSSGADAHRMLIGTFDSMLCPIYRFRHLRRKQLAPKGEEVR
jgi:hypothetical protein